MTAMTDILRQIVDNKRREVEASARIISLHEGAKVSAITHRSMSRALTESPYGIIAEFKRRSPSKGDIHPMAMVNEVIPAYTRAGASACSVLTDTPYFGGALTDLAVARTVTDIPLLRKDFIVSEFQILEAAIYGADAILLIASALNRGEIDRFTGYAHALNLEVLLELHSIEELDKITDKADMIGINNRNLSTFHTNPDLALSIARELPSEAVKVAESGLTSMDEVHRLRDAGYRGFLIGETFMRNANPGEALSYFLRNE